MTDIVTTKCMRSAFTDEHADKVNAVIRKLTEQYGVSIIPTFDLISRNFSAVVAKFDEHIVVCLCDTVDEVLGLLPDAAKDIAERYKKAQDKCNADLIANKKQDTAIDTLVGFWWAFERQHSYLYKYPVSDEKQKELHASDRAQELHSQLMMAEDRAARSIGNLIGFKNGTRIKEK